MDSRDAGRVEFRINGIDERSLQRQQRRQQPRRVWSTLAAPVLVAAGIVAASSAPSVSDARGNAAPGAANDPGAVVRGDRVLILADRSGSMRGNPTVIRDAQIASLRRAHDVLSDWVPTEGWAISVADPGFSFLQPLEQALARYPNAQSVYFISDFAQGDDTANDDKGRTQLRALLHNRGVRLYLSTADLPVPATYAELAVESGGLVVSR